jgi:hypothetical protein
VPNAVTHSNATTASTRMVARDTRRPGAAPAWGFEGLTLQEIGARSSNS